MPPSALIVDDELATAGALATLLGMFGYRTSTALTGVEAQRQVRASIPEVVLLDMMLPDLHGLEICRAWKADSATALLPVVIVSARLADQNRTECFRAGACEFVPKPFTIDQIQTALAAAAAWHASLAGDSVTGTLPLSDNETYQRERNRLRSILIRRAPGGVPWTEPTLEFAESLRNAARQHLGDSGVGIGFRVDRASVSFTLPAGSAAPNDVPPTFLVKTEDDAATLTLAAPLASADR